MAKCTKCGGWIFEGTNHRCESWFRVYIKDEFDSFTSKRSVVFDPDSDPLEFTEIAGLDHQDAAEKWADLIDQERLYCDRSSFEDILVFEIGTGKIRTFRVRGELVPRYYARPLEDPK